MNPDIANALRGLHIDGQSFIGGWSGGAPAGVKATVNSIGSEVVFGSFFAGGGGFAIKDKIAFTAAALGKYGGVVVERCCDQGTDLLILFGGGGCEVLIGAASGGPQQTAGQHVEVDGFRHGFAVVSDGCGEDFGAAVVIGPDADLGFVVVLASGGGEWCGGIEDSCSVVEFAFRNHEAFPESCHDGVFGLQIVDGVGVVGAVSGRLNSAEFEPAVITDAVTVHGAVDEDGGDTLPVWTQDAIDKVRVFHVSETFVVDDDVEAVGPVRVVVERDFGIGGGTSLVHDGPDDVGASGDTAGQDQFLSVVFVAAATGDQQGADGPCGGYRGAGGLSRVWLLCRSRQQRGEQEQGECDMGDCWRHGGLC